MKASLALEHGCGLSGNTWRVQLSSDAFPTGFTQGPAWGGGGAQQAPGFCLPLPQTSVLSFPDMERGPARPLRTPKLETFEAVMRLCPESDRKPALHHFPSQRHTLGAPSTSHRAACRGHHHPVEAWGWGEGGREARGLGETQSLQRGHVLRKACVPRQCWSPFGRVSRKGCRAHSGAALRGCCGLLPGPALGKGPRWSHTRLWLRLCKLSP